MTIVSSSHTIATAAPVNETQTITVTATGGTFTLAFGGDPTTDIAFDATSATIEAALEALDEFAPTDVAVSGDGPHLVTFAGAYAGTNVALLTVDDALATGGTVAAVQTLAGAPRTSPSRIDGTTQTEANRGGSLIVRNTGSNVAYIGGSDVTTANGFPVAGSVTAPTLDLKVTDGLYAVTTDGETTTLKVLEVGV